MLLVGGAVDLISTTNAYAVGASTAQYAAAAYAFSGLLFFAICFPLSTLAGAWERRIKQRDQQIQDTHKKGAHKEVSDAELDEIITGTSDGVASCSTPTHTIDGGAR
ncbi:hypothetical protein SDC9_169391 [bioreactor metagenome]|uniref:Uncharacterized protein n=1 Tax=bioreactor metagenome TaxID=1076179 RepID=A0A645G571_9ZZZZ